jgi:ribose transport system ATP-binding protein
MSNITLEIENLSKSFFGIPALQNVNLSLEKGQLLGLVGENGAGKSTLMNILGGVIRADYGTVKLNKKLYNPLCPADATRAGIAFIHQELNLFMNMSIVDNLFIDGFPRIKGLPLISKNKAHKKAKALLEAVDLNLPVDTSVENLSPGERQLVEIAKALRSETQIIIFDEPTTSLTTKENQKLFELIGQLRSKGKTIIYISHNLGEIMHLADCIVVLRDGRVVGADSKSEFTIDKMISMMVGREISQMYPSRISTPSSTVVFEAEHISQSGIIRDISFKLHSGEVLGLFGLMGSGRSELARILFGLDSFQDGRIVIDNKEAVHLSPSKSIARQMAFITENRREEGLLMEANVFDNIALVSLPRYTRTKLPQFIDKPRTSRSVRDLVTSLKIKTGPVEKQLAHNLSGGNQQKVVICKWLMAQPSVLIMDEPTRGIDVGAKYEVYTIINDLASKGAGILCISSEVEELMGICDRIMVMSNGEIKGFFDKNEFEEEKILHAAFGGYKNCTGVRQG